MCFPLKENRVKAMHQMNNKSIYTIDKLNSNNKPDPKQLCKIDV